MWECTENGCGEIFRTLMELDEHVGLCLLTPPQEGAHYGNNIATRAIVCESAMKGIEDPKAFMRDAYDLRVLLQKYKEDETASNFRALVIKEIDLVEHLDDGY